MGHALATSQASSFNIANSVDKRRIEETQNDDTAKANGKIATILVVFCDKLTVRSIGKLPGINRLWRSGTSPSRLGQNTFRRKYRIICIETEQDRR